MDSIITDTLIIGAGPAGLFAAIHSRVDGVVLLEKNENPGRKLLISGTGRCNLTHDCAVNDFFTHYGPNHRFLKSALHAYTNKDLIRFFHDAGLQTVSDKNGKIFPASQKAADVLCVLQDACSRRKVDLNLQQHAKLVSATQCGFEVTTGTARFQCRNLLITTGGMSYPVTGSTGDGYSFARQLGHSVVPPKPALSPVVVADYGYASLAGVAIAGVAVSVYRDNKKIHEQVGDIGFTHKGLSGPGILDIARYVHAGDVLKLNWAQAHFDTFRSMLQEAAGKEGKTALQTWLKRLDLPRSLLLLLLQNIGLDPVAKMGELTKVQRNQLAEIFCNCSFGVSRVEGFNRAMVTAGGVNLSEINPKTMESNLVPGLFFAGEVLDIDGDTGGYNLQAAFSTAFLAAQHFR